jgi:hypothetical protein
MGLEQNLRHQIGTHTQAIEKLWSDYHLAFIIHDAMGAISNLMHPSCLDSCDLGGRIRCFKILVSVWGL